jgi:hypothetical protein
MFITVETQSVRVIQQEFVLLYCCFMYLMNNDIPFVHVFKIPLSFSYFFLLKSSQKQLIISTKTFLLINDNYHFN